MTSYHIDAMAARMVMAPDSLDVVVASNLFGDILTDLGAAIQGGLGLPPPPTSIRTATRLRCSNRCMVRLRHRPSRHRQSDRRHLVRCHDARPSGREASRRQASWRRSRQTTCSGIGTVPGKDKTDAITAAVLAALCFNRRGQTCRI